MQIKTLDQLLSVENYQHFRDIVSTELARQQNRVLEVVDLVFACLDQKLDQYEQHNVNLFENYPDSDKVKFQMTKDTM